MAKHIKGTPNKQQLGTCPLPVTIKIVARIRQVDPRERIIHGKY